MSTGRLLTLKCFSDPREARRAVGLLKAAGIPSFLSGEALALTRGAAPSVKVEVAEELFEAARRALQTPPGPEKAIQAEPPDKGEEEETSPATEKAPPKEESLVTLEVFYDTREAEYAAGLLRKAGVPFAFQGINHEVIPGLNVGGPSLRMVVREGDFDRACGVLGLVVEPESPDDPFVPGSSEEVEITAEVPPAAKEAERRRSPHVEAPLKMTPTPPPAAGQEQEVPPAEDADQFAARLNLESGKAEPPGGRVSLLAFLALGVFLIWLALWLLGVFSGS